MKRIEEAKRKYEEIPIPNELSERVMMEVEKANERRKKVVNRRNIFLRKGTVAAAAAVFVFTEALNTSTAFAETMNDLPVIGAVARVLTFRSYEKETKDWKLSVEIPTIEMIAEDLGETQSVNEEIYNMCQQYADEAVARAEDYRQAFLDTGGTEEEWEAHNIEIKVWYEVKAQTDQYLSVAVMGTENWTSAYSETRYYNFDLHQGKQVTLEDILGENYAQTAKDSILAQMKEREETNGTQYWEDAVIEISKDTKFYINDRGNPVIVFEKYELTSGADGQQEFEITER